MTSMGASTRAMTTSASLSVGDILAAATDLLVSTANPGLRLTGGIGGALFERAGQPFQDELFALARQAFGLKPAPRGAIIVSSSAGLPFTAILHVVAIDVFYRTTDAAVTQCMEDTLRMADAMGARSIAIPAFATGYGRHPMAACAAAMNEGFRTVAPTLTRLASVEVWLRDERRRDEFHQGWNPEKPFPC